MSNRLINFKNFYSSRLALYLEFVILFVLPNVLIEINPQIFQYRDYVLLLGVCYVVVINYLFKFTKNDYGLTGVSFKLALIRLIPFTLLAITFLFSVHFLRPTALSIPELNQSHQAIELGFNKITIMLFYLILSAPIQELLFRSFYINRIKLVEKSANFLVLFSALAFTLIHWQFNNTLFTLGAFILGIVYATNFVKYQNIWAIIISHSIIGSIIGMLWLNF